MKTARVIDYESTGFEGEEPPPEVIEMARTDVRIETRMIGNMWRSFCHPRGLIPPQTKAIHHITEQDVADAPPARELWDTLFDGLHETDWLVAHKASHERFFHPGNGQKWIDTYKIARVIWPDAPTFSVQGLRYFLELPVDPDLATPPHRALPDSYVTAHLFVHLLQFKSPEEMAHISTFPTLLRVINFGTKAKGKTYEKAPIDYLEWIRDKSDLDEDTKFTARYWIVKRLKRADDAIRKEQAKRAELAAIDAGQLPLAAPPAEEPKEETQQ